MSQFGFLSNLVKVFPSLAQRPLYLTGESYAGTYIVSLHRHRHWDSDPGNSFHFVQPYITRAYFALENPPVKLVKIAIGNGAIGGFWEFEEVPTVQSSIL